jgi:hypothetical protein
MPQNLRCTICSIALAAIWSLACATQIAAAKTPADAQGLWVADGNYISEFQGAALASSGTPDAHLTFGLKHYIVPYSIAFDRHNNLWITALNNTRSGDAAIIEVRRADILSLKSGNVAKSRLITPGGAGVESAGWFGIGFDAAGEVFVSNGRDQLLLVPPNQLDKRRPSPAIVISSKDWFPQVLRFDSSDNLSVSAGLQQLWKFAPSDRDASGAPNPSLKVDSPNGLGIQDFAFDSSGNLWLAGVLPGIGSLVSAIEMISAGDLVGTGEISPPASLTITSSAFGIENAGLGGVCLGGIDFDHSGDLWVSAHCDPETHLIEFTPSQLSIGGNLTPSTTINPNSKKTNLAFPGPIRFGPVIK